MAIERFDDIDNLVSYYSGAESNIVKSGNVVTSVDSVYGSGANQLVQKAPGTDILHDGTTMVGQVPAFYDSGADTAAGLICDPLNATIPSSGGITMAVLEQRTSTDGEYSIGFNAAATTPRSALSANSSSEYSHYISGQQRTNNVPVDLNANVIALRHQNATNDGTFYHNLTAYPITHGSTTATMERLILFNRVDSSGSSLRGKIAIAVFYNRRLNDTEMTDLITLMQYWRDNGEAPGGAPEPNTTFGPVSTNDDPSVTRWQWEESSDGNSWDNVGTILTDISGEDTTTLTVNSAPIEADQTQVRCRAFSAKELAGVVSHTATLTVQE